jgi:hypothetical protein
MQVITHPLKRRFLELVMTVADRLSGGEYDVEIKFL